MIVTVDVEDLEILLFSTGAIKDVEAAVNGRSRDPLVKSAATKLADAHDRIAAAWRRAKRPEPGQPSASDIEELRQMFEETDLAILQEYPTRLAQTLQLVESGPVWKGRKIDWPAPSTPVFTPAGDIEGYAVRLTVRGKTYLG